MTDLDVKFDRYYTYDEMTERLRRLVATYPELATMTSLAKSFQGRDVWLIEITNPKTGPAAEKPGYYIDGHCHTSCNSAELSLVPPYYNWCGNGRFMPGADRLEGLIPEDIDGDGYIVWMRVPDPKGE